MAVTHVIRGEDHISNTPRQILLYEALGLALPQFGHLSLVLGPDHTPLSKRHGATSVAEFRERGYLPEALFNYLALIGWSPGDDHELLPAEELARRFRLEDVGHSAGVFDENKLAWVNRNYMKLADPDRLAALIGEQLVRAGRAQDITDRGREYLRGVVPIVSTSVDRLGEAPQRLDFLFDYDPRAALDRPELRAEFEDSSARAVVAMLAKVLTEVPRLADRDRFRAAAERVREATGQKGRALLHPIRVALTGDSQGPELDLAIPAIDRGAQLPSDAGLAAVLGCRERATAFLDALG
jgi:glutamyl-tRNA synthetase/nondiscriminating glutamyl-tRNA synthetase